MGWFSKSLAHQKQRGATSGNGSAEKTQRTQSAKPSASSQQQHSTQQQSALARKIDKQTEMISAQTEAIKSLSEKLSELISILRQEPVTTAEGDPPESLEVIMQRLALGIEKANKEAAESKALLKKFVKIWEDINQS